jgi:hypothetical protein
MSDETNAQECAIQLAQECITLIWNSRQLAELQLSTCREAKLRFGSWSNIRLSNAIGGEGICDSRMLPKWIMSGWKAAAGPQRGIEGKPGSEIKTGNDFVNFVTEAIAQIKDAPFELRRLLSEGEDYIRNAIPSIPQQPHELKFGTAKGATMTEAVLTFSSKAVKKFDASLMDAVCGMVEVKVLAPNGPRRPQDEEEDEEDDVETVVNQIKREFRSAGLVDDTSVTCDVTLTANAHAEVNSGESHVDPDHTGDDAETGNGTKDELWIAPTDAEKLTELPRSTLTRAADRGEITDNGVSGRGRKLYLLSVKDWVVDRGKK